ncbi:transcriptional regulator YeiL [Mammaliicoccus sciuri]|uniref:transcriptional regulator YeiL n=1 Tax=Mammaliicoccus sciuri TaxID=1296 RepID=UPI000E68C637|nr:transcriptional regulator YeiL [Mammaliicoccus sciuri]MCE5041192.1 transcriptional regulator YeiL [Mammaliicoccus sciuri]RIN89353.1 transcriptional regulator YeiL [Mammaliicoccus sciuri]
MREIYNDKLKQDLIDQFNYLDLFGFDVQQHVKLFFISQKDHIIQDTQKPEYLFYLVKGKTKLYEYMENGQVSLIDFFAPSSFIGEMELIDEHVAPLNELKDTLLTDPVLLKNLLSYIAHKNMKNIRTSTRNQSYPLSKRLASFILVTEQNGKYEEKHTQVAQYLGVSYRHLLFVIADFVQKGYLAKENNSYNILNMDELKKLANI